MKLNHVFVQSFPEAVDDNTLYISMRFATALHKCACGCGEQVITPFSPTDWKFMFDGEAVSLTPSIGNWSFKCRSHYWIKNSNIVWAESWSVKRVEEGRKADRIRKDQPSDNQGSVWQKLIGFFK